MDDQRNDRKGGGSMTVGRFVTSLIGIAAVTLLAAFLALVGLMFIGLSVYDLVDERGLRSGNIPATELSMPLAVKLPGAMVTIGLGLVPLGLSIFIIVLLLRRIARSKNRILST